jgi:GWxTD domain-containing protein|tara:strand:- start:9908 stop:11146 length:1239 start_codon:yes stop_codon:yes gene_type:complete
MRNIWKISILPVIILFSCGSSNYLSEFDLSETYESDAHQYKLSTSFHSINDSISELCININPNDFLYTKTTSNNHLARYAIKYKIFTGYDEKSPIDSASIHYSLKRNINNNQKSHRIKTYAPLGKDYIVKIILQDENRKFKVSKIQTLRKKHTSSRSYYKIEGINNNNLTQHQTTDFKISKHSKEQQYLKIMRFESKMTSAPKPHAVSYAYKLSKVPDSTWFVVSDSSLTLPGLKNHYYHFVTDTNNNNGFSVFCNQKEFPKVSSIEHCSNALGYLLGKPEYAELLRTKTPRKEFEKKWITLAGNRERARKLISEYYKEVSIANQLFTCNQPGWSTDRGMIYILFGPPRIVYRYDNSETWIYGEENNLLSEQFRFNKINTDIADNIFELNRNINYKVSYNRMVNTWIDDKGY